MRLVLNHEDDRDTEPRQCEEGDSPCNGCGSTIRFGATHLHVKLGVWLLEVTYGACSEVCAQKLVAGDAINDSGQEIYA